MKAFVRKLGACFTRENVCFWMPWLLLAITIIGIIYFVLLPTCDSSDGSNCSPWIVKFQNLGPVGDFFGGMFNTAAMFFLAFGFLLQTKELRESRVTQNEIARSHEENLKLQLALNAIKSMEASYFAESVNDQTENIANYVRAAEYLGRLINTCKWIDAEFSGNEKTVLVSLALGSYKFHTEEMVKELVQYLHREYPKQEEQLRELYNEAMSWKITRNLGLTKEEMLARISNAKLHGRAISLQERGP